MTLGVAAVVSVVAAAPLSAGIVGGPFGQVVGIRATVTAIDHVTRDVDFDVTLYTQYGTGASGYLGSPFYGFPAVDYGDGSTLSSSVIPLASPGGGPGGTNVFRGSFRHTYPAPGTYTMRVGSSCCVGLSVHAYYYPSAAAATPTYTYILDLIPNIITGNPALTYTYSGTFSFLSPYVIVYSTYFITALSNIATYQGSPFIVIGAFSAPDVPTASEWALLLLGLALACGGLWLLRR